MMFFTVTKYASAVAAFLVAAVVAFAGDDGVDHSPKINAETCRA